MAGPIDTVNQLVDAINRGDLERAVAAYEPGAVLLVQPDQLARGSTQIRGALTGFIALKAMLTSEAQQVIEAGDVALYMGRWNLRGTDPAGKPVAMAGESADILRRQEDGRWLIALDNPWGAQVLASRRGESGKPPNKRMKLTKPAMAGWTRALQLIRGVGQT